MRRFLFVLSSAIIASVSVANAATLTLAGTLTGVGGNENDQIDSWRTTSVVKTLDFDSDNIYGSDGYVMFAVDDAVNGTAGLAGPNLDPFAFTNATRRTLASIPSYLSISTIDTAGTGVASSYGYRLMDDPSLVPGPSVGDVESGAALRNSTKGVENSIFDFTIGANFPTEGLRLGIFFGNTDGYSGSFRLEQTFGGTGNITVFQNSASPLEMAFFDITNAAPGDTFRLYGMKDLPTPGNQNDNFLVGGFTFDAVPEPASTATLLAGFGTLMTFVRRRRVA